MAIRKRGASWQADKLVEGNRVRKSFKSELEARRWELESTITSVQPVSYPNVRQVFRSAYDHFWRGTKNDRDQYRIVEWLIDESGLNANLSVWTTTKVRELVKLCLDKGNTKATINRKLSCLSKVLKYAKQECDHFVMPSISFYREDMGRVRWLTDDEERRIFEHFDVYEYYFVSFLVDTGFRFSEATGFEWSDYNGSTITCWRNKSNHPRTIPLTLRARRALEHSRKAGDARPFEQIGYERMRDHWRVACSGAGLERPEEVTLHTLRHTCCSRLVQRGLDIRKVQVWMGHKDIRVTLRYAHLAPNDLQLGASLLENRA